MVFTEENQKIIKDCFKSIYLSNQSIQELKEKEKVYADSIKDTFKSLADKLELNLNNSDHLKALKEAYTEYVKTFENPEKADIKNEIFALIKTYNLLDLES